MPEARLLESAYVVPDDGPMGEVATTIVAGVVILAVTGVVIFFYQRSLDRPGGREGLGQVVCYRNLFLAKIVETTVVVQRKDGRSFVLQIVGDQQEGFACSLACDRESNQLPTVAAFLNRLDNLRI